MKEELKGDGCWTRRGRRSGGGDEESFSSFFSSALSRSELSLSVHMFFSSASDFNMASSKLITLEKSSIAAMPTKNVFYMFCNSTV